MSLVSGPRAFHEDHVLTQCYQGEPEFVERMQRTYHDQAKRNKATIAHCCGFDSVNIMDGVKDG